jgi:hypothetical protein
MGRRAPEQPGVSLCTRVPRTLRRAIRLHCTSTERPMMDFVREAIEEKLGRDAAAPPRVARTSTG